MSTAPPLEIDIAVESDGWPEGLEAVAETALRTALDLSGAQIAGPAAVSVLLADDAAQQALNAEWRGKDKPTNVLSFPAIEPFAPVTGLIGDISLARETLEREAAELDKSFIDHFTHLLVHGLLHCLGYDHENEADALVMERLETQILERLGIDDPYGDSDAVIFPDEAADRHAGRKDDDETRDDAF